MSNIKIVDDTVKEEAEFAFNAGPGVEVDELSHNAMGGTELMKYGLHERLDPEVRDGVQIICSRVREVDPDRPSVLWLHDMFNDPEAQHLEDPESRARFSKLVYVSHFQKNTYELAYGIKPSEGIVLPNAIEPIEPCEKATDEIRLIYHTTPHRGLDILIPVFEELSKHYPTAVLDVYSSFEIYGWKDRDVDYEPIFERCRNHPKINYHGYRPNEEIREALRKAHIFAFPSVWPETSSIAAIEAMSAGVAIVHSQYAALPETIPSFGMSYTYHEDVTTHANIFIGVLASAMDQIHSPEMKNRLQFQKAYADSFYSWKNRTMQWNSVLRGILNDSKANEG